MKYTTGNSNFIIIKLAVLFFHSGSIHINCLFCSIPCIIDTNQVQYCILCQLDTSCGFNFRNPRQCIFRTHFFYTNIIKINCMFIRWCDQTAHRHISKHECYFRIIFRCSKITGVFMISASQFIGCKSTCNLKADRTVHCCTSIKGNLIFNAFFYRNIFLYQLKIPEILSPFILNFRFFRFCYAEISRRISFPLVKIAVCP